MHRSSWVGAFLFATTSLLGGCGSGEKSPNHEADIKPVECKSSAAGLSLPPGFCASVFADNLGHVRHMTVAKNGTLYVNTWSGAYYADAAPPRGPFIVALRDQDGNGKAEIAQRFGPLASSGATGGTGIQLHDGWLYVEDQDKIVRYHMGNEIVPRGVPEVIVSGLPMGGEHFMHQFVIDDKNNLFVNSGAKTNACEIVMRVVEPKVTNPCVDLEKTAGIWRFAADKTNQKFSPSMRYATGIRNIGGIRIASDGQLYVSQHGRDSLPQNWPKLYSIERGTELPSEELIAVKAGGDYGWPYCYYDGFEKKRVLAPEYGGDGKKVGMCASKEMPVASFPSHWAPNDLTFYDGNQFPAAYRDGAFVAFHGSWNRAPKPQGGFKVVFQPLKNGKAAGPFKVFADGFAGSDNPDEKAYRPSGLAVASDGSLYVGDDTRGRIWRITYSGSKDVAVSAAPKPKYAKREADDHGVASLPLPPNVTREELALGARIFHGEKGGTCSGCHGANGTGAGGFGPRLNTDERIWVDGSLSSIEKVIKTGVLKPKRSSTGMPALGGAPLSDADVHAVASYVWAIEKK